jgi:VWFA-related protein
METVKPSFCFVVVTVLAVGSALSAGQTTRPVSPQTPPTPTFKAEVEYVEVDALVTDEQGRFLRDLRKVEFQIFEDGKQQTISSFALVEIPVERNEKPLFASGPVEPDVQSNEQPFAGRVYVLMLDDLHTAPLRAQLVKRAARQFIDRHLGANDLMAVVHIGGPSGSAQDFTSNKRLLLAAVDQFVGQKLESATLARNNEFFTGATTGRIDDPFEMERGFNARSTLRAVRQIAEWMGGVRGRRKTILFISEGIDYDISDVFNNRSASSIIDETRDAVAAATRSNVSIYAIDPRGLTGLADDAIEVGIFADQVPARQNDDGTSAQKPGIGPGSLQNELRLAQDSLRTFSDQTNGFAAVNSNDFTSAFDRIVNDNSAYYVLAYYPPSNRRDGKFHRIDVRTSRRGVRVRARRGYMAPRGNPPQPRMTSNAGASSPVREALNSPLPETGVSMRVFAAPFKGVAPNASVLMVIELRGRDLAFANNERVELSYVAVDPGGKVSGGDTDFFTLAAIAPDLKARVQQTGLRTLNRLTLPPGRYQLRVAARNSASGAVGSVNYDLEIPDFYKLPFSMSGVLLTSTTGVATLTARADELLKKLMPAPPVSLRRFPQNDELLVFAEIYDRPQNTAHTVDIATTVRSDEGTVVFEHSDERSSSELQGTSGGYGHTAKVPLDRFKPGRYVLTIEARSRLGQTVSRQIQFEVVPN